MSKAGNNTMVICSSLPMLYAALVAVSDGKSKVWPRVLLRQVRYAVSTLVGSAGIGVSRESSSVAFCGC